ncbi:unnamed protein product [Linum tenue]|uniref:Uncharacterized protein n=1 Tax=Linum tenue TaxID=586396 RepID=A0AAV0I109_9ROSI|nr:unnamed protein product [Linum tenue]
MEKYPGTRVARPDVFQNPEDSILWPEEILLPGNKYLIISSTTAEKLKHHRRHHHHGRTTRERPELCDNEDTISCANITWDEQDISEENVCQARDFYASKDRWSRCSERKTKNVRSRKRQPFVPPLPRSRSFKGSSPLANPTPITAPTRVWVAEIGRPSFDAPRTTEAAANSAAKPLVGVSSVIFLPIVAITLYPHIISPATIPNPPHARTSSGITISAPPPVALP